MDEEVVRRGKGEPKAKAKEPKVKIDPADELVSVRVGRNKIEVKVPRKDLDLVKQEVWPAGTHMLLLDVRLADLSNRAWINRHTGRPFENDEVIELISEHAPKRDHFGGDVERREGDRNLRLCGEIGEAWLPTSAPITTAKEKVTPPPAPDEDGMVEVDVDDDWGRLKKMKIKVADLELHRQNVLPAGTHVRLLDIGRCQIDDHAWKNPNTKRPFRKGDVIELLEQASATRGDAPYIQKTPHNLRLYGRRGRDWIPTLDPLTEKVKETPKKAKLEEPLVPDADDGMVLLHLDGRVCQECDEGGGCNRGKTSVDVKVKLADVELIRKKDGWPAGTHFRVVHAENCHILDRSYINPKTGVKFKNGDVIVVETPHDPPNRYGRVGTSLYGPFNLNGQIGRDWIPTLDPLTEDPAGVLKWQEAEKKRVAEEEAERIRQQEQERLMREAMALQDATLKDRATPEETPYNWENGESYMRARVGAAFLRVQGACPPPIQYMSGFPAETPAAEVWKMIMEGKPNPKGQAVQFYWLTRIIGYVPGLAKEALKKVKILANERAIRDGFKDVNETDYDMGRHYESLKFRQFLHEVLPWHYVEHRLRQAKVYVPTKWEAKLGLASQLKKPEVNAQDPKAMVADGAVTTKHEEIKENKDMIDLNARLQNAAKFVTTVAARAGAAFTLPVGDLVTQLTAVERFVADNAKHANLKFAPTATQTVAERLMELEGVLVGAGKALGTVFAIPENAAPVAPKAKTTEQRLAAIEAFLVAAGEKYGIEVPV
jgi:hypothetical protein